MASRILTTRVLLGALLCLRSCAPAYADRPPRCYVECAVESVYDGDTITVDVLLPWGITLRDQTVRMAGFDAPEVTRTRRTVRVTANELRRGAKAREALRGLLDEADAVYLSPAAKRDPYGRLPASVHVWFDGKLIDVAEWMTERGHVREAVRPKKPHHKKENQ